MLRRVILVAIAVLMVGTVLVWVESDWVARSGGYYAKKNSAGVYRDYYFHSDSGHLSFTYFWQDIQGRGRIFVSHSAPHPGRWAWGWEKTGETLAVGGFAVERYSIPPYRAWWTVAAPYWAIVVGEIAGGIWWWRRTRGRAAGLCPACGYDLRATPERCPECGKVLVGIFPGECVTNVKRD